MKIFYSLSIFISLCFVTLGGYLVIATVANGETSYFAIARIILGSLLVFVGATAFVAAVTVIVSDKWKKHRLKNKGEKK